MNALLAALFVSAFVFIQCYISGTRLAFSLPAYSLIALAGLISLLVKSEASHRARRLCVASTAVLFGYALVRNLYSPVEYLARADFFRMLGCLLVYALAIRHFTATRTRLAIFTVMFVLAAAEVLIGLRQFSFVDDWMPFGLIRKASGARASGTFISPIHFAGYLEAVAPFALAIGMWGCRNVGARLLAFFVAGGCYIGVLISGSRGAWLSAGFSLLVLYGIALIVMRATNRRKVPLLIYAGATGVIFALVGLFALIKNNPMLQQRMEMVGKLSEITTALDEENPYDIRVYAWKAALDQWRLSKWTGTGSGTYLYYGREFRRPEIQTDPEHVHSDYLELLAEYGILGALAAALFLAAHCIGGIRSLRAEIRRRAENPYTASPELAMTVGALVAFSAYLAHSAVDFNLHLPGNAQLFALIFGILATRSHGLEDEQTSANSRSSIWFGKMATGALAIALAGFAAPKILPEAYSEKARVAVRSFHYDEAIGFAKKAIKQDPLNPFSHYHLGQAHRLRAESLHRSKSKPDLLAAVTAFRAAHALFPQDEDILVRLGQTLDALGEYSAAKDAYLSAIERDPKLGILYAFYARHLTKTGRQAEAEAVLQKAKNLGGKTTHDFLNAELVRSEEVNLLPK